MKKLSLFALVLAFITGCVGSQPSKIPQIQPNQVLDRTIALVVVNPITNALHNRCSGTFISQTMILSAQHCIAAEDESEITNTNGQIVQFQTRAQSGTDKTYHAIIWAQDSRTDLAVLKIVEDFPHSYTELSEKEPVIGETVYSAGHPGNLTFSFYRGILSSVRVGMNGNPQRRYHFEIPGSFFGASGGGLYNEKGELFAISQTMIRAIPGSLFSVDLQTVKEFIKNNPLK